MDILRIGIADGFLWFPFVLGIGLLFTYFKEIDVSVDGIAILSGISCAFTWKISGSYFLSLLAGVIVGMTCSTIVCGMQTIFRISSLIAGIVFSLAAHSLSVIIIGESLVLPNTHLIAGFGTIRPWQIVMVFSLFIFTLLFYNTRFGLAARKLGDGCVVNTVYSASLLKWSGYLLSGFLYGLGGAIYAHSQGLAKSGGSFEFLLVALSAYLCTVRISDFATWAFRFFIGANSVSAKTLTTSSQLLKQLASSPAMKALLGAILFETLLFFTITTSPNPMLWKLIFALLLIFALAKPDFTILWHHKPLRDIGQMTDLKIHGLSVHYDIGTDRREVFSNASSDFSLGVNLISAPNGAGKSTLLKTIAGLVKADKGQLACDGIDLLRVARHARPCFLLQQNPMDTLAPELTVAENLFVALNNTAPFALGFNKQSVLTVLILQLEKLGVRPIRSARDSFWNKPVVTLSGGEAHCVAFYCALLSGFSVLADEPTTGLDEENFERLTTIMTALSTDRIILLTSHDSRMTSLANKHFTIRAGKIEPAM